MGALVVGEGLKLGGVHMRKFYFDKKPQFPIVFDASGY